MREELIRLLDEHPYSREKIIKYIENGDDLNFSFETKGRYISQNGVFSPVSKALQFGDFALAKIMVTHGAKLNIPNTYPLLELCLRDGYSTEQFAFFVEHGANVNERNNRGFSPFFNVAWDNNEYVAQYLYQAGADIHVKNWAGYNAILNCISGKFNPRFLAWLIEIGVDPFVKDKDGEDILFVANKNHIKQGIITAISQAMIDRDKVKLAESLKEM